MGQEHSAMKNNVSISDKQLAEKLRNDIFLFDGILTSSGSKISLFEDTQPSADCCKGYMLERPLLRATRNLKIYRHPYSIVKYLGSSDKVLVTEKVSSLEKSLKQQSEIETCLGLKNILNALIFLVESAKVRHLNISIQSIYITENTWKLFGFEHLFKGSDITRDFLQKSRPFRDQEAIDPSEDDGVGLEQFAFATLCEKAIKKDSQIPFVQEFLTYCQTHLKHKNPSMRPLLSAIQLHNYFNHDFVLIHTFLSELSLKTQTAKQDFFKNLNEKLRQFDENIIGSQLSELLLSRLVLLDPTAQFYLIPFMLRPQNLEDDESSDDGLFTAAAFIKYIVPRLKQVFCVLDVQIRLILLEHFHLYVNTFTKEELSDEILPQLLLGIKDTNDLLVTKTLLCLADLIPILGANQVIGKNRRKLFADGRPQQTEVWNNDQPRSITPVLNSSTDILLSSSPVDNVDLSDCSTKNPSPETIANGSEPENSNDDLTDNEMGNDEWNWDQEAATAVVSEGIETEHSAIIEEKLPVIVRNPSIEKPLTTIRPKVDDNIDDLDIKNRKLSKLEEKAKHELDFFSDFDMTPVIEKPRMEAPTEAVDEKTETNRLQMSKMELTETDADGGWDDDNWNGDL